VQTRMTDFRRWVAVKRGGLSDEEVRLSTSSFTSLRAGSGGRGTLGPVERTFGGLGWAGRQPP